MDNKAKAELIRIILPYITVYSDCSEESPEFLSEINPKKNGLNITGKDRKYFGKERDSLKLFNNESQSSCLGLSVAL